MAFSDFPDPQRLCYPSGDHYLKYLQAYSSHFELESHITYNSEIVSARRTDDRRWSLEVRKNGNNDSVRMQCDALIVATGANSVPKQRPAGLEAFQGRVFHSTDYDQKFKDEVLEKKLRVLVVGGGESGADVSAELADLSPRVSVWLRRIACVSDLSPLQDPF
jgi:dimethylaniline monooxygenase (N-oxide forming)